MTVEASTTVDAGPNSIDLLPRSSDFSVQCYSSWPLTSNLGGPSLYPYSQLLNDQGRLPAFAYRTRG